MKIGILQIILVLSCLTNLSECVFAQAKITPRLQEVMSHAGENEKIDVVIGWSWKRAFTDEELANFEFLSKNKRQTLIVIAMKEYADSQQINLKAILEQGKLSGEVENIQDLWAFSRVACQTSKNLIFRISELPEITFVDHDPEFPGGHTFDTWVEENSKAQSATSISAVPEWGVSKINAPAVWQLGYQGQGVLVAVLDDGCNYNHSDIVNHLWDGSNFYYNGQQLIYHGWDAVDNDNNPIGGGHGTSVTGIVVGDGTGGRATGVAPGATVMIIRNATDDLTRETKLMAGFQFLVDMKNTYGDAFQLPDIVTMSQTMRFIDVPDYEGWRNLMLGFYDLGVLHTNSAGNLGASPTGNCDTFPWRPIPWNVGSPANCPPPWLHPDQLPPIDTGYPYLGATMAVGATNEDDVILNDSGRGPSAWEDIQSIHSCQNIINPEWWQYPYDTVPINERKPLLKPDVVAPGKNLYSKSSSGGYVIFEQTSAATPHVAGAAALLLSANPTLSPTDLSRVLQLTAVPLGDLGKDNVYGAGRIDAYQATLLALSYANKSISTTATASNNGRRMIKDSSGRYHLIFESGAEIFYRRSNVGGTSWESPIRLSGGNEQNRYPSIAERSGNLYVVWQRNTGTNTYDILFRHFNGSSWETTRTITGSLSVTSDPLPVIAISTPSASFEMMTVYRTGGGPKSRRSTSTNGSSWESEVTVTSVTSAGNLSLTYSVNDYANFETTWDNGSHVYYRHFYGSTWGSEMTISNGLGSSANAHEYSSFGRGSNNNRHIVWQATDQTQGNRKVIFHNLNLNTTQFTKFYSTSNNYLRPSISGWSGSGGASLFWHESSANKIRYAKFNGSYWEGNPPAGTVYGSNGIDVSAAVMNPPSTPIKAVWRSTGSSPFSLSLGSPLPKSAELENIVYSRQLLYACDDESIMALRMFIPQITGENKVLEFPAVANDDSLVAESLAEKLTFDFVVPANAEAAKFDVEIYAKEAKNLLQSGQADLQIGFALIDVEKNQQVAFATTDSMALTGETKTAATLLLPLTEMRSAKVRIQPVLSGVDLGKVRGALVHEYGAYPTGSRGGELQSAQIVSNSPSLSVQVHPNPFNPSTQIRFSMKDAGMVTLRIYNLHGQLIRELLHEHRVIGEHTAVWNGRDDHGVTVASGVYFIQLEAGHDIQVRKVMLLR
jgi:subtilisin family serine protease